MSFFNIRKTTDVQMHKLQRKFSFYNFVKWFSSSFLDKQCSHVGNSSFMIGINKPFITLTCKPKGISIFFLVLNSMVFLKLASTHPIGCLTCMQDTIVDFTKVSDMSIPT